METTPAKAGVHLSKARAMEKWIPAFPTDQVRGLKAHGMVIFGFLRASG